MVRKTREKNRNWDSERNGKVRKNKEKKRERLRMIRELLRKLSWGWIWRNRRIKERSQNIFKNDKKSLAINESKNWPL